MESKQVSQLTTGVMVIVVGLLLLGHELHLGLNFGRLWPLLLIIVGVSRYASTNDEGRRGNGGWLLLVGTLLLLHTFRILLLGDSWPFFVIGAGVAMMFGNGNRRSRRRAAAAAAAAATGAAPAGGDRPGDGTVQS